MSFIELHARSAFHFLHGASSPEEMVARAAALGLPALALLDRNGFHGTARAHHQAKECGVRALVGTELLMDDGSELPMLVKTRAGYQNLCRLLTRANLTAEKGKARVKWHDLAETHDGLIALWHQPASPVARLLPSFGKENIVVAVSRHHLRNDTARNRALLDLAEQHGLCAIASNAPAYASREGRMLQDAFTALRHHTTLDEAGLLLAANAERHLKDEHEIRALFADHPALVDNTGRVAERLEFTLENLGYEFPVCDVPPHHDQASFLRERSYAGARVRYGAKLGKAVKRQLEEELSLITRLGFCGYFLIVWSIVDWCRQNGILVQGRGSAANSIVCYSLGITSADPIKHRLLFARFLSEGRDTWPDIDLDLPSGDRRESVIQEIYRRFAPHGAAMTANVITYRGRSAMREMGKVLGLPPDVIARFSDLYANGDFPHTLELRDQIRRAGMPGTHPRLPAMVHLFHQAYGLPRHLGQHSGGMVLCTSGLDKIVPLEPATMKDRVVVQWDKDDCEDLGIIKVDLLGLGMMAVLEETFATCAARGPQRGTSLHDIPPDDPETYEMLQRADTIGVFQVESRAQQATLPRMKPKCFYDLVIEVAIIRPGPIVGKMVNPYLNRRAGKEQPDCIHPCFKDILDKTLGVPLFQEQILQMAMMIADFTGGEAEELRRAMSFHRSEERMNKVMAKLRAAMTQRKVTSDVQDRIVSAIQSFALYGFPESHAISFALLAYASAWLRRHRLAEFTAALLNNQPMGFYSSATLIYDAKQHGLRIQPVCVARSDVLCTIVDDTTVRLGLNQLNGISATSRRRIISERGAQPWRSLDDFILRCQLPVDELQVLASSGALNALGHHRRSALWAVAEQKSADLFTCMSVMEDAAATQSVLPAMTPAERLEADYATQSFTTGPHPMAYERRWIPRLCPAAKLATHRHGDHVAIGGMVICRQRPGTAKGHVFISLEDETGIANAFVPSSLFEARRLVITQEPFLQIRGMLQHVDNVLTVCAHEVDALRCHLGLEARSHDFH
jgi:error-prone DNA polymerase